jgi:hypothetical protein
VLLLDTISGLIYGKLNTRFELWEITRSVQHVAARWLHVLTPEEKAKVGRILGGNSYAKSAEAVIQVICEGVADEQRHA